MFSEQSAAGIVAHVSVVGQDSRLEIAWVRSVEQQLFIVVGFNDEVLSGFDCLFECMVNASDISSNHESGAGGIDNVADALSGVVRDGNGVNVHTAEREGFSEVEVFAAGA